MTNALIEKCKDLMNNRITGFEKDLVKIRTGRASISVLDNVRVDYYGTPSPLNQVATLSTPDARTILISPFEKKLIQEIERSIMKADLGLQPNSDGVVVRVPIPQLNEERRKEIVKQLKKMGEEAKVGIRHARRDINEEIKKEEKDKLITEDESKRLQDEIQKLTDTFIKTLDDRMAKKEKEVMTV
jgi:ribosome recycling factor